MAYVTEKRGVHDAVIYEGTNPVTGREQCRRRPRTAALEHRLRR